MGSRSSGPYHAVVHPFYITTYKQSNYIYPKKNNFRKTCCYSGNLNDKFERRHRTREKRRPTVFPCMNAVNENSKKGRLNKKGSSSNYSRSGSCSKKDGYRSLLTNTKNIDTLSHSNSSWLHHSSFGKRTLVRRS